MNIQQFYCSHSKVTHPGQYTYLFNGLPDDVDTLCDIVQHLVMHYADEDILQYKIPHHRYHDMDARYVEEILRRLMLYDAHPLTEARAPDKRLIGVCRDTSILLCAMLRHKNIPARLRIGFANYFLPAFNIDAVCVEYWDKKSNKWRLVDSRTNKTHIDKYKLHIDFDLHDLPPDKFIPAELAWALCRSGTVQPNRFGSRTYRGAWYVRNRLLQEIALINKKEMLIWDMWGAMLKQKNGKPYIPDEQYIFLDDLSQYLQENARKLSKLTDYYQAQTLLHVPTRVAVYNPFLKKRMVYINV